MPRYPSIAWRSERRYRAPSPRRSPASVYRRVDRACSASLSGQNSAAALRPRIERESAPDDLLDDVWLVELCRLLPELRERYPDLPALAADEMGARLRLYEALARLVMALAERAPVVFFIDVTPNCALERARLSPSRGCASSSKTALREPCMTMDERT